MQEINSAAKKRKTSIKVFPAQKLHRLWLQDDELREGGEMVGRMDWGGKREKELQKGRCRRKGGGLAEKRIRF